MRILLAAALAAVMAVGASAQAPHGPEESALLAADAAFNEAVADRNIERFLDLVAEDATFAGGGAPLHGRDAIKAGWARYFDAGGPTLTWTPRTAQVLAAGRDVGVTTGSWVLRGPADAGRPVSGQGEYLTVWRKHADGRWRVVFDTGSTAP